ncbi:hypothetical protein ALC57_15418 [Trachymyrmex cornetzi]|uniref:DNA-directed DNA polymerase n=1 Tax=Trachymyrmex cornetzi TaxID=471704 RepID=A0A151IXA6_9HYME|nr:hypothetical protein ALC57_15418 [Trachymyrmex cornetzi]
MAQELISTDCSIRAAARFIGSNEATLRKRLKVASLLLFRFKSTFSREEEEALVERIKIIDDKFYGISRKQLMTVIYQKKYKSEFCDRALSYTLGKVSDSGFINSELFINWLKDFTKYMKPSQDRPILLILDNYISHCSLSAVDYCQKNGITLLSLPPHSSHKLQPLDVAFFGPLKKFLSEDYDRWTSQYPEFATNDKRANKSITTKNIEIYRYTDLREWYQRHVMEPTLTSLEEFQERDSGWALSRILNLTINVNKLNPMRYYVRCSYDDTLSAYQFHRDENCIAWFARQLNDLAHRVKNIISANVPMEALSKQQWEAYRSATRCHICEKPFEPDDTRVRDHCHLTGRYRGPAHSNCNLNYKNSFNIPVVFHNLSGYDAHFIIKEIATAYDGHVDILPITKEKYISFTKHVDSTKDKNENYFEKNCVKLRFIDSYKFLSTILDKFASFLRDKLKIVRSKCPTLSDEEFEFRWIKDVANFDASAIAPDSPTGYILEVDLEYPQHLRDQHIDLPFCPMRHKPPGKREDKLLAMLYDKQRYVIHYRNLQQCTRHGLRVTKIHRILQFAQSPWLREYIELNTQFRTRAKNDFEKNFYKLMNNAVFGKTMENVRNHVDVKLITKWDGRYGAEAMIAKPNFHSRSVFAENLIAIEICKLEVMFDKPIYVGMCIFDISKVCLYEFHHEYILPLFCDKCKIIYTDTDSLIYRVECEDVYETMKRNIARFDTSDYPIDNAYGMPLANKKVLGLMKDENNGAKMTEFAGLRAKMYAVRVDGKKDTKKAKGVKSIVVARTITFDDYTRCLNEEIEMTRRQSCIRSKLHEVYTISESKIALNPYDDKRYFVPDSTETLPWGHWRIRL